MKCVFVLVEREALRELLYAPLLCSLSPFLCSNTTNVKQPHLATGRSGHPALELTNMCVSRPHNIRSSPLEICFVPAPWRWMRCPRCLVFGSVSPAGCIRSTPTAACNPIWPRNSVSSSYGIRYHRCIKPCSASRFH